MKSESGFSFAMASQPLGGKMFRCFQMFLWTIVTHAWWAALSSRRGAQDTTWNKTKCGILIEMRSGVFWRGKGHVAQKLTIGQFIISEVRCNYFGTGSFSEKDQYGQACSSHNSTWLSKNTNSGTVTLSRSAQHQSLENMWCSEQMIIERYKVTGTQKISCQEGE